jgi:capsular polysaccharide biosynthesis protein
MTADRTVILKQGERTEHALPLNYSSKDGEYFAADSRIYQTFDVALENVGTAQVSSDSVIYIRGRLKPESVVVEEQIAYYKHRHLIKKTLMGKRITLDANKNYLLVTDAWSAGHFHWFMEVLPKLMLIESRASEFVLLLPDTPYVRMIGMESLELLGIKFEDVVWMGEDQFFKVPDLYYITRVATPGQVNDAMMKSLNGRFRSDRGPGTKRFYISRSEARIRKVLNESELEPVLRNYGIETVRPESLSLREQIDMFAECATLIGIHGAGLTNCLFMPPGGNVVELRKPEPNFGYWHLADSVGHKYYYYHGVADSELSLIGAGCNLTVPVEDFEQKILRII